MHKQGGWDGQYLSYNVCSLALVSQGKGTMIGVTLDSPSDSWVPTHGATSVPSMPAFSGNPIFTDTISPRYPRKPQSTNVSTRNSSRNRRSRSSSNLVEAKLKTQGEHRHKFRCRIRHPLRDVTKIRFLVYMSSDHAKNGKKWHFGDAPLNFAIFDLNC